jgi:predicted ATP-grasp superfamily ATP-dependent carboligase
VSIFSLHAAACAKGVLPSFDLRRMVAARLTTHGKAVVFARAATVVGDTRTWLGDDTVHDVPRPGERIATGHPICTVFAGGASEDECRAALAHRAAQVYANVSG